MSASSKIQVCYIVAPFPMAQAHSGHDVVGRVDIPATYSPEEAVLLMQEAGVVGADGSGFPTYAKFRRPGRMLVVDATESEPGHYAGKLLVRDDPSAFLDVVGWLKATFGFRTTLMAAEDIAYPYLRGLEEIAHRVDDLFVAYTPPRHGRRSERELLGSLLGTTEDARSPWDIDALVIDAETAYNVHRAVFRERPVTTKFLHVYGEVSPDVKVVEAPIGTLAADLLQICGVDLRLYGQCILLDGGPVLAHVVADPMGAQPLAPVTKTTSAFLVADPRRAKARRRHYPSPDHEDNGPEAPWAPSEIVRVAEDILRVRVPLGGPFMRPGVPVVDVGDDVGLREPIAEPAADGFSVAAHASIAGRVTQVTPGWIEIVR